MLTEQEISEITVEASHYEEKRAASIEALKIVQRHRGWVSDETLREVADLLEMTADELDNVATFYNLIFRRPVGRHVIQMCDSVSCWILGYESIYEHLRERLGIAFGETTADGEFTLIPNPCLGCCDRGPALLIGDDLHTHLTPERIDTILAESRRRGASDEPHVEEERGNA